MENLTPGDQSVQDDESDSLPERLKDLKQRSKDTNARIDQLRSDTNKLIHGQNTGNTQDAVPPEETGTV